jgi:hypothetical protein
LFAAVTRLAEGLSFETLLALRVEKPVNSLVGTRRPTVSIIKQQSMLFFNTLIRNIIDNNNLGFNDKNRSKFASGLLGIASSMEACYFSRPVLIVMFHGDKLLMLVMSLDVLSSNLSQLSWLRVFIIPQFLRNITAPLEKAIIIIIIIWFVRLLALRPLLAYCASLG